MPIDITTKWQYTPGTVPTWRHGDFTICKMRDERTNRDDAYHVYFMGKKLFVCLTTFDCAIARLINYQHKEN